MPGSSARSPVLERSRAVGVVPAINTYDEYGVSPAEADTLFQYTGQHWVAAIADGLYNYKNRFYHARLGRFLQPDPIGYWDSANLYAYVLNDPVNYVDPLGLTCIQNSEGKLVATEPGDNCADIVVVANRPPSLGGSLGGAASGNPSINIGGGGGRPGPPQQGDLHFIVKDYAICSADALLVEFMKPGGSAPDAPAAQPGTTFDVPLLGGNPITQIVNVSARRITNVTQLGHRYHSGTVEIRITPTWYGSAVTIEGRGTGPYYVENSIFGKVVFGLISARATVSCSLRGK